MTHTSVAETKRLISSDEFTYWQAMFGLDPWGEDWMQTGTIAALMCNQNRARGAPAVKPDDFVFRPLKRKKKQSPEDMQAVFKQFTEAFNSVR